MLYEEYINYKQTEEGGYEAELDAEIFCKILDDLSSFAKDYKKDFKELYYKQIRLYQYWGTIEDYKYSLCKREVSVNNSSHTVEDYTVYAEKIR